MATPEAEISAEMAALAVASPSPKRERATTTANNANNSKKEKTGLCDLPNDLLMTVMHYFDSARDVRALLATSRRFRHVVDDEGWRVFVRSRFASLDIPSSQAQGNREDWKALVESLTWQSRCWDRRSIRFAAMYPRAVRGPPGQRQQQQRGGPAGRPSSSLAFRTVLDARFDLGSRRELVVWGAGQDIVARYRHAGPAAAAAAAGGSSWSQIDGAHYGFAAGYGDVQAINIVDRPDYDGAAVLAGRANGDLSLFSVKRDDTFGTRRVNFSPDHFEDPEKLGGARNWQKTIASVDIFDEKGAGLVAVTTNNGPILVYRLPESLDPETTVNAAPAASYDLLERLPFSGDSSQASILNAKWMGESDMAVALRGPKEPLMYLTMTPSGWEAVASAKNRDIEVMFGPQPGALFPNSLQPVRPHPEHKYGTKLLLSSWRDGTVRLMDIRTPSVHDLIYQDNVQPTDPLGPLLPMGTERFLGGSMDGATIKIFDFRWTKGYVHTDGLPCASHDPFPAVYQPFSSRAADASPRRRQRRARCGHALGRRCDWHRCSRDLYHRPNALFMMGKDLPPRLRSNLSITSLAKGSDVSPNFYAGISGAVIEGTLSPSDDADRYDPHLGFPDWPRGALERTGYETIDLRTSMMEVGDGRSSRLNGQNIRLPPVLEVDSFGPPAPIPGVSSLLRRRHRLDARFHKAQDFELLRD